MCDVINHVVAVIMSLAGFRPADHKRITHATAIARHRLLAEAQHLNVVRNTKDAISWQHVDLIMRAFDRWPGLGHVFRGNWFKPVLGKAVFAVLEYSGLRPFCLLRCGANVHGERFGSVCPFKLGQLTLCWPSSGGIADLVIHGVLFRTENGRDLPLREDTAGVPVNQDATPWGTCG